MVPSLITSVIDWIRTGYPEGVPSRDFQPLLALLQRSLTADEVEAVLSMVVAEHPDGAISHETVLRAIEQVKDAPPSEDDVNDVAGRLAAAGWPLAVPQEDLREGDVGEPSTERLTVLQRVLGWLRAGYPDGVPQTDYMPILAILHRRLTDAEVKEVTQALIEEHSATDSDVITEQALHRTASSVIHEAPDAADLDRVRARLAAKGWPLEGERQGP